MAASQLNILSSMIGGGYNGPDASPPPSTLTSVSGFISMRFVFPICFLFTKLEDAKISAAPPSALLAHSNKFILGAIGVEPSTSCND